MQQHHVRSYDVLLPSSLFTNLRLHMLPPPLGPVISRARLAGQAYPHSWWTH